MHAIEEIYGLQMMAFDRAHLGDLLRLPPEAKAEMYFHVGGNFLARLSSSVYMWNFFIELNQAGYLSGSMFSEARPGEWSLQIRIAGQPAKLHAGV